MEQHTNPENSQQQDASSSGHHRAADEAIQTSSQYAASHNAGPASPASLASQERSQQQEAHHDQPQPFPSLSLATPFAAAAPQTPIHPAASPSVGEDDRPLSPSTGNLWQRTLERSRSFSNSLSVNPFNRRASVINITAYRPPVRQFVGSIESSLAVAEAAASSVTSPIRVQQHRDTSGESNSSANFTTSAVPIPNSHQAAHHRIFPSAFEAQPIVNTFGASSRTTQPIQEESQHPSDYQPSYDLSAASRDQDFSSTDNQTASRSDQFLSQPTDQPASSTYQDITPADSQTTSQDDQAFSTSSDHPASSLNQVFSPEDTQTASQSDQILSTPSDQPASSNNRSEAPALNHPTSPFNQQSAPSPSSSYTSSRPASPSEQSISPPNQPATSSFEQLPSQPLRRSASFSNPSSTQAAPILSQPALSRSNSMSSPRSRNSQADDLGFLDHQLYMTNRPLGRCLDEAEATSSNSNNAITSVAPTVAGPSSSVAPASVGPSSVGPSSSATGASAAPSSLGGAANDNDDNYDEEDSSSTIRPPPARAAVRPLSEDEAARLMEEYQARRPATTNATTTNAPVASVSAEPGRPIWAAQPATGKWRHAHLNHFPGPAALARRAAGGETSAGAAVPRDTEFVATRRLDSYERYVAAVEGRTAAGNPGNAATLAAFQANLERRGAATPTPASSSREALLGLSAADRDPVEVGAA